MRSCACGRSTSQTTCWRRRTRAPLPGVEVWRCEQPGMETWRHVNVCGAWVQAFHVLLPHISCSHTSMPMCVAHVYRPSITCSHTLHLQLRCVPRRPARVHWHRGRSHRSAPHAKPGVCIHVYACPCACACACVCVCVCHMYVCVYLLLHMCTKIVRVCPVVCACVCSCSGVCGCCGDRHPPPP